MKYKVRIYEPLIGVPSTWMEKYVPSQYKLIGKAKGNGAPKIGNKNYYVRILIQKIKEEI